MAQRGEMISSVIALDYLLLDRNIGADKSVNVAFVRNLGHARDYGYPKSSCQEESAG